MMRKKTLLILALSLTGCGAGLNGKVDKTVGSSSTLTTMAGTGRPVSLVGFQPATSNVTSIPTSVVVNFDSSNFDSNAALLFSNYSINCAGGAPFQAQSVAGIPGTNSVRVTLPTITGFALGTQCNFVVSQNLKDIFMNFITGDHAATYTLSNTAGSSASVWNEALSASNTATVGSATGSAFNGIGASGMALQGLLVNGTQYVDGIGGVWAPFGATSLTYGQTQGATAGGFVQLSCPVGFRVTGIYGKSGSYIDSIGLICKNEDQTQTFTGSLAGGTGGSSSYSLECPAGKFATDLNGRAGGYVNQLYLGCR